MSTWEPMMLTYVVISIGGMIIKWVALDSLCNLA